MSPTLPPAMQSVVERLLTLLDQHGCTDTEFDSLAAAVFEQQYLHNEPYRRFCQRRGITPRRVTGWRQVPPVPISAFKDATLSCVPPAVCERVFMTSGTSRGDVKGRNHLLETTLTGLAQVPAAQLDLFRMLGATRWQTLLRLKLPSGLPAVLAGLRVAVVLALVGVVVGEFISASRGLGALVIAAQGSMDTPLMFAVLVLVALLGLGLYALALCLEWRLLRRYTAD